MAYCDTGDVIEVGFSHLHQPDENPCIDTLNTNIIYGNGQNYLRFRSFNLTRKIVRSHDDLRGMVDRIAYDPLLYMQSFEPMSNKIRHIIGEFIQGGGNFPDSFNVAQHLGISPSTLSRRLRQENTSFQDLKSSCQEAAAKRFLRQGDLSMHEISQRLGFWDVRSFRRAFQNWTGVLPSTFRSQSQFPTDA